ncbi:MAG: 4Fe-4S dicluster domain-containing protein, partial [Planctomycetota bacterium]
VLTGQKIEQDQVGLDAECSGLTVLREQTDREMFGFARALGYKREAGRPVWALRTEGVLAIDRALTLSRACSVRIVSLGGPGVESPVNLKAVPGYPIELILENRICEGPVRVINGGVLTGQKIEQDQVGLDAECSGLTVLREQTDREMFGFARAGAFPERFTTGMRGEERPCVSCGFCEEVCPAGIMPHLLHKLFYQDAPEQLERARLDLCVECGLCSFVCPSKIELRGQFIEAKELVRRELHAAAHTDASQSPSSGGEVEA